MNPIERSAQRHIIVFLMFFTCTLSTLTAQQTLTTIAGWNAYVHVPQGYDPKSSTRYPLIVFWPGVGEVGTDASKLLLNGPNKFIKDGWNGQVTVNGVVEKPILISVQPKTAWPGLHLINACLDSIIKRWSVDQSRMYFTGLSHGGWVTNCFVSQNEKQSKVLAATVAMSAVIPQYPYAQFDWFAKNGGETWQFEGNSDLRGNDKINTVMNATVAGSARYTLYNGGHCCWNTYYNPTWTENGESIYQWMLKHSKNKPTPPPANIAPVAKAGADKTITLPLGVFQLDGSASTDADGSIKSYAWSKISGPSTGIMVTPNLAITLLTELVAGTYEYQLQVTDDKGAVGKDTVKVTVNPLIVIPAPNTAPVAKAGADKTVTLPLGILQLDGTASTDADGSIKSYAWTKVAGPSTGVIATPNQAITQLTGLVAGTYSYQLQVTDDKNAIGKDTVNVIVNPAIVIPDPIDPLPNNPKPPTNACKGKRYKLTPGPYYIDLTGKVSAGDTVVIQAGDYGFIELKGLYGTAACPITIINEGGQAKFEAFNIAYPASHVRFTGTGTPGVPYGFFMKNKTAKYWGMHLKCEGPFEVDHVEITGTNMGIQLKDDNAPPQLVEHRDFKFHNLYIHDIAGNEGMYIGSSTTPKAPKVKGVHIYDVLIENTTREGLQISNAQNVLVERVKILQPSLGNGPSQNHAFNMGHDVQATARNMYIQSSPSLNVFFSGGRISFECSTIDGTYSIFPITDAIFGKNYEFDPLTWVETYQQFTIKDILLKNAGGVNIASLAVEGPLQANVIENIKIEGGLTTPMSWGPAAKVANVGTKTVFTPGCVPPTKETVWATNWPANSPGDPSPVNSSPFANAGNDTTITLPNNTVILDGSKSSDSDGSITKYAWVKASGPTSGTIKTAASASTTASGLVEGTYKFELRVTDNNGAVSKDEMVVTVKAAPPVNKAPVAKAGADVTITLPTNSVTLNGTTSTDADGTIESFEWKKLSGPSAGTITTGSTASTTITGLVAGSYTFELTVTDDKGATSKDEVVVTVNAAPLPPNQVPVAKAGADVTITLPTNSVTLNGTTSADADGTIESFEWKKLSGPSAGTITTGSTASTTITGLVAGSYTFELTVADDKGATSKDEVVVTVNAAPLPPNQVPVAKAGADVTITLPTNSVTLNGTTSADADGTIESFEWKKLSGPSAGTITTGASASTTITGLVAGSYTFELTVTDDKGATSKDEMVVTVKPAPPVNKAPVAKAGADVTITLPTNSVTLNGTTSTDADGTIDSFEWKKLSGPSAGTITTGASASTTVTGLVAGSYTFELTVTDDKGATSKDEVVVTVNAAPLPPNQVPVAKAGNDITITLPTNSVTLNGTTSTDADGTIESFEWKKLSGPSAGTITTGASVSTTITGLVAGSYTFELTVTDDKGATSKDEVVVTVNAAPLPPNQAPVAKAGNDITITLPTNSVTLNGTTSTDADGTIDSFEWKKLSGPSAGTITTGSSASTTVTGLVAGSYTFELTVTDDNGATSKDEVVVTVNAAPLPPNQAPVARAGNDMTITLPTNSATLNGNASTDADGAIVSYHWNKLSGPSTGAINTPNSISTVVNSLVEGTYKFELTVTDDKGATSKDEVVVTVNAAPFPPNQAPVARAGNDVTITLPTNSVTLDGTTSNDPDGQLVSYSWIKISGPNPFTMINPSTATPTLPNLPVGVYVIELVVTDDRGATATNRVTITVNPAIGADNLAPVANAGPHQQIMLPMTVAELDGSASKDDDGTIESYSWTQKQGPNIAVIANRNSAKASVSGLIEGEYVFELSVVDNKGATSVSSVTFNVVYNILRTVEEVKLYPVPARDVLNFEYSSEETKMLMQILIYDANGKVVLSKQVSKDQPTLKTTLDVSALSNGAYFFTVVTGLGTAPAIIKTFIVSH